jgi:hypothetical protein
MTAINITAINVLDNPTLFVNPFQFEIQYECTQDLQHGASPMLPTTLLCGAPPASVLPWPCTALPRQRLHRLAPACAPACVTPEAIKRVSCNQGGAQAL